jgi:death-on-curing protein
MITLKQVLVIHNHAISKFGGESGLRDKALLESAINRPYQTYGFEELYLTAKEKAPA